ncbi:hypothetical protein AZE42_08048, partial [Rhizopogon vesiculosus]
MVLTSSPQSRTCGIYVLDMVKGSVIYHVGVPAAGGVCDVQATLTENWLVYQYFDIANRKNSIQSTSRRLLNPRRPKQKPTSEEQEEMLVQYDAVLPDDARLMLSHNYEVANVRRIVTSPSLLESTSLVFEEMLVQYDAVLPDDARLVLSHNYEVANVRRIVTSPSLLESTSLVF